MADVKPRRITEKDLAAVSEHLKNALSERKKSVWRERAEEKWKEVDRQIAMEEMARVSRDNSEATSQDWHAVFELGELSMASEIYSADVERICFPMNRSWFEPKCKAPEVLNPQTGQSSPAMDAKQLKMLNGTLQNMMAQQHMDFGLKARVSLSLKEAFHHGGFVATAEYDNIEKFFDDGGTKRTTAPVWKPHSMWNCYPDQSPSVIAENMYYQGSMFIETYMPWEIFKQIDSSDKGYWAKQLKKVTEKEHQIKDENRTKDVKVVTYYGDIYIKRGDGDIFLPNMRCRLYNDVLCYAIENPTPYQPVLYCAYERMDVRDPYGTSPIIKQSPFQKMGSVLANRLIDSIELDIEPPLTYDKNDPDMVATGGPQLHPGSKIGTANANTIKELQIGNPAAAQEGLVMVLAQMQQKLGISPFKSGVSPGDRMSAREAAGIEQGTEVRQLHFITKLEAILRGFLYMQHAMNLAKKDFEYDFYNSEMGAPDFMTVKNQDLPRKVHFEVVGARGVLGEAERSMKMGNVTAFVSKTFPGILDAERVVTQMYEDAGVKHPEMLLRNPDGIPPEVKMMVQQMQQAMQEMGKALQESESGNHVKLYKASHDFYAKMKKITFDHEAKMMKIGVDAQHDKRAHAIDIAKFAADQMNEDGEGSSEHEVTKQTSKDGSKKIVVRRKKTGKGHEGVLYKDGVPTRSIDINQTDDGYEGQSFPIQ